jgi:hypothetical protein
MTQSNEPKTKFSHTDAFELLPWYVNESLPAKETALVREHLSGCAECRKEIISLNALQKAAVAENGAMPEPGPEIFSRIVSRIEDYEASQKSGKKSLITKWRKHFSDYWSAQTAFSKLVFAGQFAALLLLALAAVFSIQRSMNFEKQLAHEKNRADRNEKLLEEERKRFVTLTGPDVLKDANAILFNVAFQEEAKEKEIRELLESIKGRIVGGPSPQRFYTIAVSISEGEDKGRVAVEVLEKLRGKPRVVSFAEARPEQK